MYNFMGWQGANSGHLGVFLNAEDQDNYDFVYFRFVAIYRRVRGKLWVCWFQTRAAISIFQNLLTTSSVYGNDFGVLQNSIWRWGVLYLLTCFRDSVMEYLLSRRKCEELSHPKNPKMCDAILETPLKMQSYDTQTRRENATLSSDTSPLASTRK